jgi:hypothetical protein
VSEMKAEAQFFRDLIVSAPRRKAKRPKPTVAVSSDVSKYVELNEDELRWIVEEAGPKALEMLRNV